MSFKIAVLASTRGTTLQAILDELKAGHMPGIELSVVISDKTSAYALIRAREQGYPAMSITPHNKTREEYDREVSKILDQHEVDLIVLIGYMRILSPWFVNRYKKRIINIHPSLIPKYCGQSYFGTSVHRAVLDAGETETGITIHYVDEGVDTGEIILQKTCQIPPGETPETLKAKVQQLEKLWYPEVIRQLAQKAKIPK